ncbi:MAG: OmpA family protein [Draconibacterium sp.]|nr:OmpA family protein [Draconibacterium sp.]
MNNNEDAITEANKILDKTPGFLNAYLLLADIYSELDSTALEIKYLENARKYSDNRTISYRLAESCRSIGLYGKAITYFKEYLKAKKITDFRKAEIRRKINNCKFAINAKKHPVEFKPIRLSEKINTTDDEYWPSLSIDQRELVFTRLVKKEGQIPQEDFFVSEYNLGSWGLAKPIIEINTSKNEGAQSISVNGKFLLFTACNRSDGYGSCDIYYSKRVNGKWSTPKNAGPPVNSKAWETQPSFSSDNRYLYFSSNRSGGKGKKDIWRAEFLGMIGNGKIKWGEPENLGDSINTQGNEISPFIHANNKSFYYASDYRYGMGGFDLFNSQLKEDNTFSKSVNLGYPINTLEDEQGLNISADGTTAFFSSARETGTGLDIYTFELEKKMRPEPVTYAEARVTDAITNKPVLAKIELINLSNLREKRTETADKKGEALLCFPLGANYAFNVSEKGYLFYSQSFQMDDSKTISNPYKIRIKLQPIKIGAEMNLYNIYFETDSFKILTESEPELQNLSLFLKNNPELNVEIQGHTDNTGNPVRNQQLSELRAKSVVEYLIANNIDRVRMKARGFGEKHPVATNNSNEGRRLNRRTTVKIIGK